jgi:tRNA threonylcarbamoyladenosine biosynthesis protein TsaB
VTAAESLLAVRSREAWHGQAEALMPMVDAAMCEAALPVSALDLVAASVGPGSFTGIRAGLAAAQGIAVAARLPLIGVTGFAAIAAIDGDEGSEDGRFLLVAIESRRAELFVQLLLGGQPVGEPEAVRPEALGQWIALRCGERPVVVAGDGARRAAAILAGRPRTDAGDQTTAIAVGVARAALARWRRGERGGAARPLYLRAPDVTLPRPRDRASLR